MDIRSADDAKVMVLMLFLQLCDVVLRVVVSVREKTFTWMTLPPIQNSFIFENIYLCL